MMRAQNCGTQASLLKKEATQLITDMGLAEILRFHGHYYFTGSYAYNLMTRREIDVCVEVADPQVEEIFAIGREIAALPGVGLMSFRNEFVFRTPGNPQAMFWTVDVHRLGWPKWKVDLLFATPAEVQRGLSTGAKILHELNEETRARILELKMTLSTTKEYGVTFRSTDIYEAVMMGGVKDLAGWNAWWMTKVTKSHAITSH